MEENNDNIWETAIFGKQVEDFIGSEIGKYIIRRAESEVDSAVEELKHADPHDPMTIIKFQSKILVAESVQQWLADAIKDGWQATAILEDKG